MTDAAELVGTWELIGWLQEYDDGRTVAPMGERPDGILVYSPDGRVIVMIAAEARPSFVTGGQWDADVAEKAKAYDGFLAYFGTYSVTDGQVIHHVRASLFPNWAGVDATRTVELDGDRLSLLGRLEEGSTEARTVRLAWHRDRS